MLLVRGESLKEAIDRFHWAGSRDGPDPGVRPLALRRNRGPFAVRAAVGIASVCGLSWAESARNSSSDHPLEHGLDRQSRRFDGPSPLV
jgi:hypothetical protein